MADKFAPTYALTTRSYTSYADRYRWVISGNGKPVQLIKTSRTSLEVLGPLEPRNRRMANVIRPTYLH